MMQNQMIDIKIERNLMSDLKNDIFVTEPGMGRHHCLMGIHQVGKTTLVSDWASQWNLKRKQCIEEFIEKHGDGAKVLWLKREKIYEMEELPGMAKVFFFEDQIYKLDFWKIKKVLKEIQENVLVREENKNPSCYTKKKNDYLIRTKDGFCVKFSKSAQKQALETIEGIYGYFSKVCEENLGVEQKEYATKVKELFRAFTVLGFHFVLVFDEFNNSETMKKLNVHGRRNRHMDDTKKEENVEIDEGKESFLQFVRELYPYVMEGGVTTGQRLYNLSILIVSRQEMGMITGEEDDNIIFKPWCLDGFSNSELEEFIKRLKSKKRNEATPYEAVSEIIGEKELNAKMIHFCGRHPGLWGKMWVILNEAYDAYIQNKDVTNKFESAFRDKSKEFFRNVIHLMKNTKERIDNREEISALKIFIHHFVDSSQYPIPKDPEKQDLKKYLEMMEKQGFVSFRNPQNSSQILERKAILGMTLDDECHMEVGEDVNALLGYEMHSPYMADYINSNVRDCYGYDVVDVKNASEECESVIRKLLDCVYRNRYGEQIWLVKVKNRMTDLKKLFWYLEVCKQYKGEEESFAQMEKAVLKKCSPWESLAYSDYADLMQMHSYVFKPVFDEWTDSEYFSENTFVSDMKKMAELRDIFAHRKAYEQENIEKDIVLCQCFLKAINKGCYAVESRAKDMASDMEENIVDLYDIDFICKVKDKNKIRGEIEYNHQKWVAQIAKSNVSRKVKGKDDKFVADSSDTYFEDELLTADTIKVDVVKLCKDNSGNIYFNVQPMERSGVQAEWLK